MRIIISGGSGFLGQSLARFFTERGDQVSIISRSRFNYPVKQISWSDSEEILNALEGSDVLINLAGKSVNCRYTEKNRQEILDSRVATTRKLGTWLKTLANPPKAWLNASTATIYRHTEDRPMTEANGEIGDDFSMNVAKAWEAEFFSYEIKGMRQVAMRTSIVMGNSGGAYIPLKRLTKLGLGGKMGTGTQMVSWIHIEDFCRAVAWIIDHPELEGPVIITAPNPVTNAVQMKVLRNALKVPFGLPATQTLLRIGALLIGTETELILKSRWVLPEKLQHSGFNFAYPEIQEAFFDLSS